MMELTLKENITYKLGNDVLSLQEFEQSINPSFIRRVFTEKERAYANQFHEPNLRYASTFSAKEAVYKALKQFDSSIKLPWKKIEITREKIAGKPEVELFLQESQFEVSLSISHDGNYVWAVALAHRISAFF
ncbi:MAG: 4'-phosphopantetheinyl transferase superfamily protein [Bacteroidota bacterium]